MNADSEAYVRDDEGFLHLWLAERYRIYLLTRDMRTRLRQTESWIDAAGRAVLLRNIDARYAKNIIRHLERLANALHAGAEAAFLVHPEPTSDAAWDSWQSEMDCVSEAEPMEWLRSQPLYRALAEIAENETPKPRPRSAFARAT